MVRIPNIKIPSVRVGSIGPTSNIGTGGATPAPPTPITYLTQWKIVGNSEVHTLPYPDGVVLPNGYKRCSYLASNGTAYIELPFGFNKTDDMYAKVNFNAVYPGERHIISTKTWNVNNDRFCFGVYNSKFAVALGDIATPNGAFTPNAPFNKSVCEVSYSNNQFTLLNEGNTFVCDLDYAVLNSETTHVCLLKNHKNEGTEGAIYEYRHKKGNTEYRLIPCLDSNDTPCMYDVINNQAYYNSADSGGFTYELYPQPTEIWSCGEYNATDGKYHILVQPLGGSIADIALTEPLRKVNNVADTIEFPSGTEGKALITRNFGFLSTTKLIANRMDGEGKVCITGSPYKNGKKYNSVQYGNILCNKIDVVLPLVNARNYGGECLALYVDIVMIRNGAIEQTVEAYQSYFDSLGAIEMVYELNTPTTELVDAPQIAEADSYSCEISQGAKAVSWSSFETNSE